MAGLGTGAGPVVMAPSMGRWTAVLALSYLLGSISWSYILVKAVGGRDLRREGSGNLGALNAGRSLGWKFFVLTFVLDAGKGALAVIVAKRLVGSAYSSAVTAPTVITIAAALAALGVIIGHDFSIFLRFGGGKGLAAGVGALLATDPWLAVAAALAGAAGLAASRSIYAASLVAALLLPVLAAVHGMGAGAAVLYLVVALVIVYRHRGNLRELWRRRAAGRA